MIEIDFFVFIKMIWHLKLFVTLFIVKYYKTVIEVVKCKCKLYEDIRQFDINSLMLTTTQDEYN